MNDSTKIRKHFIEEVTKITYLSGIRVWSVGYHGEPFIKHSWPKLLLIHDTRVLSGLDHGVIRITAGYPVVLFLNSELLFYELIK